VPGPNSGRLCGLDWLRAGAALAVVALHAGIPYMEHPLPHLSWCVLPTTKSSAVDLVCWAINVCVMPVFFLMGGYLAAGMWRRRPGIEFLKQRTQRMLIPLALAILLVLPADMYVWLAGWVTEGLIPLRKMRSIKLPEPLSTQFWGVAHLWYLECLWMLSVGAWAALTIRQRWDERPRATLSISKVDGTLRVPNPAHGERLEHPPQIAMRLVGVQPSGCSTQVKACTPTTTHLGMWGLLLNSSRWPMLICGAIVSGLLLAREPQILIGFQQRWWPSPTMTLFYATFFVAGWRWPKADANPTTRPEFGHRVMLAVVFFPVLFVMIRWHVERPLPDALLPFLTIPYALFGWLAATGLLGLATRTSGGETPRPVRYVAEGSFWMYLVHHPLVGLTQLAMLRTSWPAEVRFSIAFGVGTWLSLGTYGVFVRGTWLSGLLSGSSQSRVKVVPQPSSDEAAPIRRAA